MSFVPILLLFTVFRGNNHKSACLKCYISILEGIKNVSFVSKHDIWIIWATIWALSPLKERKYVYKSLFTVGRRHFRLFLVKYIASFEENVNKTLNPNDVWRKFRLKLKYSKPGTRYINYLYQELHHFQLFDT